MYLAELLRHTDGFATHEAFQVGVIVKSGVSASELGGDLVHCFHLDSIFEFNPGNHLCQVAKAA
jgi:hypothetical protein